MKAKDGQFVYFPWLAKDRNWLAKDRNWPVECLDIMENRVLTWRIIPASKWLRSLPFTSHKYSPFFQGVPQPYLVEVTITIWYNHKKPIPGSRSSKYLLNETFPTPFFLGGGRDQRGGRRKIPLLKEWFPSVRLFSRWKPGVFVPA